MANVVALEKTKEDKRNSQLKLYIERREGVMKDRLVKDQEAKKSRTS